MKSAPMLVSKLYACQHQKIFLLSESGQQLELSVRVASVVEAPSVNSFKKQLDDVYFCAELDSSALNNKLQALYNG